jgi:hypothetical protein
MWSVLFASNTGVVPDILHRPFTIGAANERGAGSIASAMCPNDFG